MRPFQPLDRQIPDAAAKLSYSEYRAIAFDRDKAIWNNTNLKFRIEAFFRASFTRKDPDQSCRSQRNHSAARLFLAALQSH